MGFQERVDQFFARFEAGFQKTLGKHVADEEGIEQSSDRGSISSRKDVANATTKPVESGDEEEPEADMETESPEWAVRGKQKRYFGFLRTPRFWLAFFIGQVLSLCITCTNTLTTEMGNAGTSMPLFQNLLNYALLAIVHNPIMWYKYGFRKWFRILVRDSWRFFILAFIDVQGNYFVVLAYEYTNMLSAALLDNFAIVVVVILSFVFLHVRYHWSQYIGIVVTVGGMALLIVSDRLTGKDYRAADPVKGDLFVLLGAACYGFSNTFEEFLVSERPLYEVLGNMGFWAVCINGVQLAIFERKNVRDAKWTGAVGGYLTGYTMTMFLLYHLAPFMFRISSAAFYNLNVLTSDFWSLLVGIEAFGYYVYWLYPVGFVFTVLGIVCYCAAPMTDLGEGVKPWLGSNQERGVDGIGTAKWFDRRHEARERRRANAAGNDCDGAQESSTSKAATPTLSREPSNTDLTSTTNLTNRVNETEIETATSDRQGENEFIEQSRSA